jgi:hypothetical protein
VCIQLRFWWITIHFFWWSCIQIGMCLNCWLMHWSSIVEFLVYMNCYWIKN